MACSRELTVFVLKVTHFVSASTFFYGIVVVLKQSLWQAFYCFDQSVRCREPFASYPVAYKFHMPFCLFLFVSFYDTNEEQLFIIGCLKCLKTLKDVFSEPDLDRPILTATDKVNKVTHDII
jgi:hypothetical protein